MQNDIASKIKQLASRQELLSESEVSHLMTLSGKYLDHMPKEERAAYPTLGLVCDWALHITIDRSPEGFAMLKRLNDTLVDVAPQDTEVVIRRITEVVSLRKLRGELGRLSQGIGMTDSLTDDQER